VVLVCDHLTPLLAGTPCVGLGEDGAYRGQTIHQAALSTVPGPTPHYPQEFKREAVELCRSSEKSIPKMAEELGIASESLRRAAAAQSLIHDGRPRAHNRIYNIRDIDRRGTTI
jgi:hypothetical protein